MNNVRLLAYFKNNGRAHTVRGISKTFGVKYGRAYYHMKQLVDQSLLLSARRSRQVFYMYNERIDFDNWVAFAEATFDGEVRDPKVDWYQKEDFYGLPDPTWERTKITLWHRIRCKIRGFRFWLADIISPGDPYDDL